MKKITYGSQSIDYKDIISVKNSLTKNLVTQGSFVTKFENELKKYVNCKFSLTCNSGTSALFLAYQSIGLNHKSNIIMPSINFIASYRAAKFFRANIFIADVNPLTGQMTPELLLKCIKKFNLKKIDVVNTMYLAGNPYNIREFYKLKRKYKFLIIEDACHAFGAKYKVNKKFYKIGSCKHSDVCTFSFHPLKTITTGEGGLLTTNKKAIYQKAKLIRSHGMQRIKERYWNNKILSLGMNFRLSDINCALGLSQLKKINTFLKKRQMVSKKYNLFLKNYSKYVTPLSNQDKYFYSSNHLKILHFKIMNIRCNKDQIFKFFVKKRIFLQFHYQIINNYKVFDSKSVKLKGAIQYNNTAISFPIHTRLTNKDINNIFKSIKEFVNKYKR